MASKNIRSMNKVELLAAAIKYESIIADHEIICGNIMSRMDRDEDELKTVKQDLSAVIHKHSKMNNQIKEWNNYADDTDAFIDKLEDDLNHLDTYSRRQNIEILNIPENIPNENLEDHVIAILNKMGIKKGLMHACHRLNKDWKDNKKPPKVIVRFTNRKIAYDCHRNSISRALRHLIMRYAY